MYPMNRVTAKARYPTGRLRQQHGPRYPGVWERRYQKVTELPSRDCSRAASFRFDRQDSIYTQGTDDNFIYAPPF